MTSFAATAVANYVVGNEMSTVLLRAMLVMLICYAVGWVVGAIAQRTIHEHIEQYKQDNPIPQDEVGLMSQDQGDSQGQAA